MGEGGQCETVRDRETSMAEGSSSWVWKSIPATKMAARQ